MTPAQDSNSNSPSTPMTLDELFELSAIDALGLLDDEERMLLDEVFLAQPAALQRELRRQQDRMAQGIEPLGKEVPPAELKARVMEAVLNAVASMDDVTEADRSTQSESDQGPAKVAASAGMAVAHGAARKTPKTGMVRRFGSRRNVNSLWRPTSVGLAVGLIAVLTTAFTFYGDYLSLQNQIEANTTIDAIGLDAVADVLFDENAERIHFKAVDPSVGLEAVIVHNSERPEAHLYAGRLRQGPGIRYRLVRLSESGEIGEALSQTFGSSGSITKVSFPMTSLANTALGLVQLNGNQGATLLMTAQFRVADLELPTRVALADHTEQTTF